MPRICILHQYHCISCDCLDRIEIIDGTCIHLKDFTKFSEECDFFDLDDEEEICWCDCNFLEACKESACPLLRGDV